MATSPNIVNYQYGAGALSVKVDGVDMTFRHVGNCPAVTYSAELSKEQHKQSMSGLKSTDFEFVTEVSATLNATLEEVTPENMALFVMGTGTPNTAGDIEIGGLTLTEVKCDVKYESDNPYGAQIVFEARASISPNGEFNFITDGLNSIPVQFTILRDEETGNFGTWTITEAEEASA